jgi:hypothetical protein
MWDHDVDFFVPDFAAGWKRKSGVQFSASLGSSGLVCRDSTFGYACPAWPCLLAWFGLESGGSFEVRRGDGR